MNSSTSDTECSNTRQCSTDGVLRVCYRKVLWTDKSNFCDCSSFFGWVGKECDEVSGAVIHFRFALLFCMTWSFILVVRLIIDAMRVWKHRKSRAVYVPWRMYGKDPGNKEHLLFCSLVAIFFGFSFLFISSVMEFPSLVDPTRFELREFVLRGRREELAAVPHDAIISSLRLTVAVLYLIATLLISLTWLSLADTLAFFHFFKISRATSFFRVFAKVTIAVLMVTTFILPEFDLAKVRIILTSVCGVIFLILFILGRRTFLKIVRGMLSQRNTVIDGQLRLVSVSSGYTIVLFACAIISFIAHFLFLESFRELTPPGGFSYALVSREIGGFFGLCLFSIHYWYVRERMRHILRPRRMPDKSKTQKHGSARKITIATIDKERDIDREKSTSAKIASHTEDGSTRDAQETSGTFAEVSGNIGAENFSL